MKLKLLLFPIMLYKFSPDYCFAQRAEENEFIFELEQEKYPYVTSKTGDSYNFEFGKDPGGMDQRLTAALHVLQSVFNDPSIDSQYSEAYTRERAKCFIFEGLYYSYSVCFLPNEFSPNKQDVFRGFVTQLPNWKWILTRNVLPALLVIGIFLFLTRKREKR